jgi:hypothetical protein
MVDIELSYFVGPAHGCCCAVVMSNDSVGFLNNIVIEYRISVCLLHMLKTVVSHRLADVAIPPRRGWPLRRVGASGRTERRDAYESELP